MAIAAWQLHLSSCGSTFVQLLPGCEVAIAILQNSSSPVAAQQIELCTLTSYPRVQPVPTFSCRSTRSCASAVTAQWRPQVGNCNSAIQAQHIFLGHERPRSGLRYRKYIMGSLHVAHRDLSSLKVWRRMANYYHRSELLKSVRSACRPMACAYGASAHNMFEHAHDMFEHAHAMFEHIHDMFEHIHDMFEHVHDMFEHEHGNPRDIHAC